MTKPNVVTPKPCVETTRPNVVATRPHVVTTKSERRNIIQNKSVRTYTGNLLKKKIRRVIVCHSVSTFEARKIKIQSRSYVETCGIAANS